MNVMRVTCPRCGKTLSCYEGESETMCNCHQYCEDGTKPSDCTLVDHTAGTHDPWKGNLNWPSGMHLGRTEEFDDTQARVKYCTVHDKYVSKVPFLVKCDWNKWRSGRAPKKLRMTRYV